RGRSQHGGPRAVRAGCGQRRPAAARSREPCSGAGRPAPTIPPALSSGAGCRAAGPAASPLPSVGPRTGRFGSGRGVFPQETELNLPACPSGPPRRFPVAAVDAILRDVLGSCLREQPYEPVRCREMVKDIAEVIKARVKDLVSPRYKIVVVTHIGQLNEPSIQIGSRCLWDPVSDTFSSCSAPKPVLEFWEGQKRPPEIKVALEVEETSSA
uniref:Uncharacterized protein n=1 Tax=Melopsittacus undulatus TaxID=13146 RepID=A0A8C6JQ83_MELUD